MKRNALLVSSLVVMSILVAVAMAQEMAQAQPGAPAAAPGEAAAPAKAGVPSAAAVIMKENLKKLQGVLDKLNEARKAIDAGQKEKAMDALDDAERIVKQTRLQIVESGVPVVNKNCPITGGKIDNKSVAPELTRDYQGQTIGFCCPACPPQWDALTDAEKAAKFQAAMGTAPTTAPAEQPAAPAAPAAMPAMPGMPAQ